MTPCWLDILDTLEAFGPMTTSELAEETGRHADQLGQVCKQLRDAGHLERGHIPAAMYRRHAARSTIDDRHHAIARGMAAMGKRRLRTAQQLDEVATWDEISAAARARCVTIRPVLAWSITPTGRERLGFWRDMGRI
jgi:hypothetical protein